VVRPIAVAFGVLIAAPRSLVRCPQLAAFYTARYPDTRGLEGGSKQRGTGSRLSHRVQS